MALVRFIRHLPSLTPEELKEMDASSPSVLPSGSVNMKSMTS